MRDLLQKYGYQKLVLELNSPEEKPAKRKYERRTKPEALETFADEPAEEIVPVEELPAATEAQLPPGSDTLTAEDLQNLLFALYVQAKAGITASKEKLDQIKLIILS